MPKKNWIYAQASIIGCSHLANNLPCQDSSLVQHFVDYSIAIVSDGAGSCANSHIGSKMVCEYAMNYFSKLIDKHKWNSNKLPSETDWHLNAKEAFERVKDDLDKFSMSNEYPFKSLSCTIIVTIGLKDGLLVSHIGDGRAGYCNLRGEWHSTIKPFHGQEANETVFITSEIWDHEVIDNYIESNVISDDIVAFCLLSDGCEKASFECNLYDPESEKYYDPNKPYDLFFNPNIQILKNLDKDGKTQEEINSLWESFLIAGNEKLKIEPDDKTLVLVVKNT